MAVVPGASSPQDVLESIKRTLETGKEYVIEYSDASQRRGVQSALDHLSAFLGEMDPALSYAGTDKKVVWRKSCWFACNGLGQPFLDNEDAISRFDGDNKDGVTGLAALQQPKIRGSMELLKNVLDNALATTGKAVGINQELMSRCTVRYRIIKYVANEGNPGGIGLHPDGNALSALITNGDGLRVYDLDGQLRFPGYDGTIMMGGSTLYRWSESKFPPTFHDVEVMQGQNKMSIVAFFNFPDMENIPRNGDKSFFHDVRRIKDDDRSPQGELRALWDTVIKSHDLKLPAQ